LKESIICDLIKSNRQKAPEQIVHSDIITEDISTLISYLLFL